MPQYFDKSAAWSAVALDRQSLFVQCISLFLADRTNGHAIGTVLRPSVVVYLSVQNVLWLNGAS